MAGTICNSARLYLEDLSDLLESIDARIIEALADLVYETWQQDHMVIVFGNGGSAATASHWVADLVKTAAVDGQRRLRAMSLTDNCGLLTALGNDISYDETFLYPLECYARHGDIVVAISASGNSPNVVRACEWAKGKGLELAVVTGFNGGKIGVIGDLHINIPSQNYGLIEDMQLSVGHMVAQGLMSRVMAGANGA